MTASELIDGLPTVSEKIRVLDAAGYSRAEIEKIVGWRYQNVRNVLNAATPEQSTRARAHLRSLGYGPPSSVAAVEEASSPWIGPAPDVVHLTIGEGGEIVLPPQVLSALRLSPGDRVTAQLDGETFTLVSMSKNLERLREIVRQYIPEGAPSLADELIADRRREAAQDRRNG